MSPTIRRITALALTLLLAPTQAHAQVPAAPPPATQTPATQRPAAPPQTPVPPEDHAPAPVAPPPVITTPPTPPPRPLPEPEPEPIRGTGLLISGGVLLTVGVPTLIISLAGSSGACWSVGGSCDDPDMQRDRGPVGLIAAGVVGILGGGTLLIVGGIKRSEWREWNARQPTLTPAITRSSTGTWLPGLTLRF